MRRWPWLLLLGGCLPTATVDFPTPPEGAQTVVFAIDGLHREVFLEAVTLDEFGPLALNLSPDDELTVALGFFTETFADLNLEPGVNAVGPEGTVPVLLGGESWHRLDVAASSWRPTEQPSFLIGLFQTGLPPPACPQFEVVPIEDPQPIVGTTIVGSSPDTVLASVWDTDRFLQLRLAERQTRTTTFTAGLGTPADVMVEGGRGELWIGTRDQQLYNTAQTTTGTPTALRTLVDFKTSTSSRDRLALLEAQRSEDGVVLFGVRLSGEVLRFRPQGGAWVFDTGRRLTPNPAFPPYRWSLAIEDSDSVLVELGDDVLHRVSFAASPTPVELDPPALIAEVFDAHTLLARDAAGKVYRRTNIGDPFTPAFTFPLGLPAIVAAEIRHTPVGLDLIWGDSRPLIGAASWNEETDESIVCQSLDAPEAQSVERFVWLSDRRVFVLGRAEPTDASQVWLVR